MLTTRIIALWISSLFCASQAIGQADVTYRIDTTGGQIFLVERIERTIEGSPRKQVIETPTYFKSAVELDAYLLQMGKDKEEWQRRLSVAIEERNFLTVKIQVVSQLRDSVFLGIKTKQ